MKWVTTSWAHSIIYDQNIQNNVFFTLIFLPPSLLPLETLEAFFSSPSSVRPGILLQLYIQHLYSHKNITNVDFVITITLVRQRNCYTTTVHPHKFWGVDSRRDEVSNCLSRAENRFSAVIPPNNTISRGKYIPKILEINIKNLNLALIRRILKVYLLKTYIW